MVLLLYKNNVDHACANYAASKAFQLSIKLQIPVAYGSNYSKCSDYWITVQTI